MDLALVIAIDCIAIAWLVASTRSREGLEGALPVASFLLVLLPIQSLLPTGAFTLTTHRLVIIVLALLQFLEPNHGTSSKHSGTPMRLLIAAQIIWSILSSTQSLDPGASYKKVLSVVFEYYVLYYIYWKHTSSIDTIHRILLAIVGALGISSVLGVGEAYYDWNIQQYFPSVAHHWANEGDSERAVRIHGTFDHPILYGAALAMGITFTVYLMATIKSRAQTALLWIALLLLFWNLYKTSSRGPWLDVMIGCGLLMIWGHSRARRIIACAALLSVLVCVIRPGVWNSIVGLYETSFNTESSTGSSYAYRYALQEAAITRLSKEPVGRSLWGFGPETFWDVHLEGTLLDRPHTFLSCDNAWVEILVETGYVGLALVGSLLLIPATTVFRRWRTGPAPVRDISFLFLTNFIMFYFQMYSVGMYSWGQNGYMLWIMIGLSMGLSQLSLVGMTPIRPVASMHDNWWVPTKSELANAGATTTLNCSTDQRPTVGGTYA